MPESNIMPGIYRVILGSNCRPPGEESFQRYKKWHEEHDRKVDTKRYSELRSVDDVVKNVIRDHKLFLDDRKKTARTKKWYHPHFFETPLGFFTAWIDGYSAMNEGKRGGILDPLAKGFELRYATWDKNDPYFQISYQKRFKDRSGNETISDELWEGTDWLGRMNRGIVLATDLNGIIDINGYMALAVNDLDAKRVYSYKPKEKTSEKNKDNWKEKTLLAGEDPYVLADSIDEPEFPFKSLNPLKTVGHTWTAIGFTPHDIFNALREIGFKFPNDSAR